MRQEETHQFHIPQMFWWKTMNILQNCVTFFSDWDYLLKFDIKSTMTFRRKKKTNGTNILNEKWQKKSTNDTEINKNGWCRLNNIIIVAILPIFNKADFTLYEIKSTMNHYIHEEVKLDLSKCLTQWLSTIWTKNKQQ